MKYLPIIFLLCVNQALQAAQITGRVTDEYGNPLPFSTLLVRNTTFGVTTNSAGVYSISLPAGDYEIACRYVGFETVAKRLTIGNTDQVINFVLRRQQLKLPEIVITTNGKDPAYSIIRNAIRQRPYYLNQVKKFAVDVYIKGVIKMLHLPEKVLGRKIPDEDKKAMALDSLGSGIIYLSESLTHVSVQKPDKIKLDVVSSKLSGSDDFGFDFPVFINFYENNMIVGSPMTNERGFVSPIADNALNFYQYKLIGDFQENGKTVHTIRVTPKRKFEPLFSGTINITEGDWRIFSCQLQLTKTSQLQIFDTLQITQIHAPLMKDIWRIRNQVIRAHMQQLGVEAAGSFVNIYSNYNFNPTFPKGFFDKVIIRYDTAANKRPPSYWDTIRPVALDPAEKKDYAVKDSLKVVLDSIARQDSLLGIQKTSGVMDFLIHDYQRYFYSPRGVTTLRLEGILKGLQYNTVEGVSINPSVVFSRFSKKLNGQLQFIADVRYGFTNRHLNPWAGVVFSKRSNNQEHNDHHSFYLAGGKRVSQFFKMSALTGLRNSTSTLLYGRNEMKLYENYFQKTGYIRSWDNGMELRLEGVYEDRMPVGNSTDFLFTTKWKDRLTPNYPVEQLSGQFQRHQALVLHAGFRFQPGQKYIQYPGFRQSLGSKYPTFGVDYYKGIPNLLSSDEQFDRWQINIKDELRMRLAGRLMYLLSTGGFINSKKVFIQDYKHFYGGNYRTVQEYMKGFQHIGMYQFSNISPFYTELHLEHHADGLITNKIPLLKRWNWNLVEGVNMLHVSPQLNHWEVFIGLENILKTLRVDAVMTLQNGNKPVFTYRLGLSGLFGDMMSKRLLSLNDKIISPW